MANVMYLPSESTEVAHQNKPLEPWPTLVQAWCVTNSSSLHMDGWPLLQYLNGK